MSLACSPFPLRLSLATMPAIAYLPLNAHPPFLIMDPREHEELRAMLSTFKQGCLHTIAEAYKQVGQELDTAEATLINRAAERFSKTEEMLSGPYDRKLQWDWASPSPFSPDSPQSFLDMKVRLRDLPDFELSAKEYLTTYVKSQGELSQALSDLGYHLPPQGTLFAHFLAEVLEGRKLLVAKANLRKVDIPNDQIALALTKAQTIMAGDSLLQKYLPSGAPKTVAETLYILEVVNSVRRLRYKVILPISTQEEKMASVVRQTVTKAVSGLVQPPNLSRLRPLLQEVQSPNTYGVYDFIETYAQYHATVTAAKSSH